MPIMRKTAYSLAIEALVKMRQPFAFGYQLWKGNGQNVIFAKRDYKKYMRINEAIEILEKERDK